MFADYIVEHVGQAVALVLAGKDHLSCRLLLRGQFISTDKTFTFNDMQQVLRKRMKLE